MKVKEITDRLGAESRVIIHDRRSADGTVFRGKIIDLKTTWNEREVVWLRVYDHELMLEVE